MRYLTLISILASIVILKGGGKKSKKKKIIYEGLDPNPMLNIYDEPLEKCKEKICIIDLGMAELNVVKSFQIIKLFNILLRN